MESMLVTWVGGTWFIRSTHGDEPVRGDSKALDEWLHLHGAASRSDLDFGGSRALEQRFVNDFGPIQR